MTVLPLTKAMVMERPLPIKLVERLERELTRKPVLTEGEIDVLAFFACGLGSEEAAKHMHLSRHTIYSRMKSLRVKLEAKNMTHAVALALKRGLLDPELIG